MLTKLRIAYLKKEFMKSCDDEIARQILQEKDKVKDLLDAPHLLMSDVTVQAYTQELIKHGVAIRLESDGTLLPDKTMRIVNKAWSGELLQRTRMTMPDGISHDPFIVDIVMTQPKFFHQYISNPKTISSGRLARTLVYFYDVNNFTPNQPVHELDQKIRELFHNRLADLLNYSLITSDEKTPIFLEENAERLFFKKEQEWREQCKPNGALYKIKDFGERMGEHALRLAGILHLAENEVGSQSKITVEVMDVAIRMVEIFVCHTFAYRIKDYGDFNRQCCREVMLYILKKNLPEVLETELKQALKHHYSAGDIDVALYYLQRDNFIYEKNKYSFTGKRVGRPQGRIFINLYYEEYGIPIL